LQKAVSRAFLVYEWVSRAESKMYMARSTGRERRLGRVRAHRVVL
jgi:hypothetical protein